jgi:YD repeat-containing protein
MKINKPYNFILSKKFPDKYLDSKTGIEFLISEINKHPEWYKYEYDTDGNLIYIKKSDGWWVKREYNEDRRVICREYYDGTWIKYKYDENGKQIYYEDSNGRIVDNRI